MFNLYDKVKMKKNGLSGVIVDVYGVGETKHYSVEADEKTDEAGGYGGDYPIFDCASDEIERVEE